MSVSGITKEFVLKDRTITAVDNISLAIQDGDFITVVGPSGCGKSTLLHIIGGLLAPD
ncbi:MAG: ATP-binding cassette domain-containing protein, partial [Spirochaetia bacterium]|nr:ATP-binding cassette domain-containing protein [Spirochaetia bacterium]